MTVTSGCDKAPGHVIGEGDMVDLLVDIYKAEAYIEINRAEYPDDSSCMVLKQSVFMKHNVTSEKFDTSMVWYTRNLALYSEVCDKVIKELEDERRKLDLASGKVVSKRHRKAGGRSYKDFGDTADIWTSTRQMVLTANYGSNILPFYISSNQESQKGDKYTLLMKVINNRSDIRAFVGIEYNDGVHTFIERRASNGWFEVPVQGDSLKNIKGVFGYIKYNVLEANAVSYVDSIMLLRTHIDNKTYSNIATQKVLDPYVKNNESSESEETTEEQVVVDNVKVDPVVEEVRDEEADKIRMLNIRQRQNLTSKNGVRVK
jgi:hypothetical protein